MSGKDQSLPLILCAVMPSFCPLHIEGCGTQQCWQVWVLVKSYSRWHLRLIVLDLAEGLLCTFRANSTAGGLADTRISRLMEMITILKDDAKGAPAR
jgi:hypothetical protein